MLLVSIRYLSFDDSMLTYVLSESGASSTSEEAAESTGAAASLSLSNGMITLSGGVIGLVAAALAL